MNLSQNYKILPFSPTCDTIFLTFSPYYNIKLQQITQYEDVLPFLQSIENQYKVIILAENYAQGADIINKINEIKQQKNKSISIFQQSHLPILENDFSNDKLTSLLNQMIQKTQNKRSLLYVKGLLNQIQIKIQQLDRQIIHQKVDKKDPLFIKKISKKIKKPVKNCQKRMEQLKNKRNLLLKQLAQKQNNNLYLKELSNNSKQQRLIQERQDQWLLYDSQEQKENNINI